MTLRDCVKLACLLDATCPKPGNVHGGNPFPDMTANDLIVSGDVIAKVLGESIGRSIGETVLACIKATRAAVSTNTNLGIVLLLVPLVVGESIVETLNQTTVDDAVKVYEAIRLAKPGGLGTVAEQDVTRVPTVTLREAMALAADRDSVARQYVNNFEDVFNGVSRLLKDGKWSDPGKLNAAIVDLHLWFLSRFPDSLVARKRGIDEAIHLQCLAQAGYLPAMESWFAAEFPHRNPGTTADLVCASLFAALRQGIITLPEMSDSA